MLLKKLSLFRLGENMLSVYEKHKNFESMSNEINFKIMDKIYYLLIQLIIFSLCIC